MSQTTKLYAAIVVLAALGGAVYFAQKKDAKIGTVATTAAELPDLKGTDDVDKISITNADKGEIVIEKKDGVWKMVKPVEATANQTNCDQVAKNLKEIKAKEVVQTSATEEGKKDYDFLPSKAVHVVAFKGADKKLDMSFGSSGLRGQMAMVDGKPGIYAVTGYSSYLFTREPKGFRDTEIFKFDDANANLVTIEKKEGTLSFTKDGDKWTGTFKGKPIENFDGEKVKEALRAFKALTADDFGDGKKLSDVGLDAPESKVTIQLKVGDAKYVLKVGGTSTGTNRWAVKDGSEQVYSIPSFVADWAVADTTKFSKPADAGAPKPSKGETGGAAHDDHAH